MGGRPPFSRAAKTVYAGEDMEREKSVQRKHRHGAIVMTSILSFAGNSPSIADMDRLEIWRTNLVNDIDKGLSWDRPLTVPLFHMLPSDLVRSRRLRFTYVPRRMNVGVYATLSLLSAYHW